MAPNMRVRKRRVAPSQKTDKFERREREQVFKVVKSTAKREGGLDLFPVATSDNSMYSIQSRATIEGGENGPSVRRVPRNACRSYVLIASRV